METALMITEYKDGLRWRETGRQVRKTSDLKPLKDRQGAVDGPYLSRTWCGKRPVKIEEKRLDGELVRFILIWQDDQLLMPVRYFDGKQ